MLMSSACTFGVKKIILFILLTSSLSTTAHATETKDGENGLTLLNEIFATKYAFAPVDSSNPECRKQSQEFLNALENLELWALKMYDSSGKIPSGLLNGNIIQFGDFDQCLNIKTSVLQGQYCLVEGFIEPTIKEQFLENIFDLAYAHRMSQATPVDKLMIYPAFNDISWGLCVPSACTSKDVENSIKNLAGKFNSTSIKIDIKMDKNSCVIKSSEPIRPTVIITGSIIALVCLLTICGTILESKFKEKNTGIFGRISLAFSLKKNFKDLMSTDESEDDLEYIHGLRAVYSIIIYCLHRGACRLLIPKFNRTELAELFEGIHTIVFRSFFNMPDVFVIISGLLASYYLCKKLKSGRKINILEMYLSRYIKFTPLFILVILIARDFDYFFESPQNIRIGPGFSDNCKNNIWKSFFYLSNFDSFLDMCYPPSHQLVTDMQMYLIAPFMVLLIWKHPKVGVSFTISLVILIAYLRYYVVHSYNIPLYVYFGAQVSHINRGLDKTYKNPFLRLIPYLFGILLGYYLQVNERKGILSTRQIYLGWVVSLIIALISFGSTSVAYRGYKFDVDENARYAIYQPILWSIHVSWAIFAFHHGHAGILGNFLGWKGFKLFSKISYAFYICQFLVLFTGIMSNNNAQYFRYASVLDIIDLNEFLILLIVSTILTLLFYLPFVNLHSEFIAKSDAKKKK